MSEVVDKKRERGKRARIVRAMTGLKMEDFAKKIGVSRGTLIGWEKGKGGGLPENGAEKITAAAEKLGVYCSPIWIMHGIGNQPRLQEKFYQPDILKDVSSKERTGKVREIKTDQYLKISHSVNEEIESFKKLYPEAVFMQITDDTMQPLFADGDIVGGSFLYGEDIKKAVNKECVIKTKNNELLCRHLISRSSSGLCILGCLNFHTKTRPVILTNIEVIAAAPIVWIRRFF